MQPTREDNEETEQAQETEGTGEDLRQSFGRESLLLRAGAAAGVCGAGAVLALADIASPVRAPFTFFFLLMAPATALAAVLLNLDPLSRAVVATGAAVAMDLLVAQGMLALHMWSVRGGVGVVAAVSAVLFLLPLAGRAYGRSGRRRTP
ncbi:hypothetical protein [Actinacidiphila oryziradicis]|uniref:hypothetical protein n=1 Tax=Actinacidiphila oryziradicis TaxID=2571141 RepID=UPI0023F19035|nr:hypothetical protein [Actinacidiphila oryziradicis]MCW2874844.1 hypothetical protein [Actinacidiphila oryziradicis]